MLDKLTQLEDEVRACSLPEFQKQELMIHIDNLRNELNSTEHHSNPVKNALNNLRIAALEFEKDHPTLTKNVNEISIMLSNMGI
ncbi:MAG TPA: DUF4404 family protein [Ignavibacteria bacterium]|nr:DUF4404 family protein [Ignavibacteria bacterium]